SFGEGLNHLAVDADFSLVGLIDAGERLDQRRFAGPIFAYESMDFSAPYRQIDMVESQSAQESFGEAAYRDGRRWINRHCLIPREPEGSAPERDRPLSPSLFF